NPAGKVKRRRTKRFRPQQCRGKIRQKEDFKGRATPRQTEVVALVRPLEAVELDLQRGCGRTSGACNCRRLNTGTAATKLNDFPYRLQRPNQCHKRRYRSFPSAQLRAAANAASIFAGDLPPAWAESGRPPPLPSTCGAISLIQSPA